MCDGLDCGQLWMTAPASCDRRRRLASRRRAWLLPTLAMLVFCSCLSVAGYQTSDPDVDAELRAARLYDEAVKRCGAGTREALNDCNRLLLQSVALVTNQALALLTLGHTYRTMQSWEDAIGAFRRVLTCTRSQAGAQDEAPAWVMEDARMHLGRALIELDRWDEAIQAFEAAFTAFPHASEALFRHLYLQHFACNFTRRAELLDTARERVRWEVLTHGGSRMTPSQALMMLDSAELQILAQSFAAGHLAAASTAAKPHGPWVWTLDPSLLEAPRAQAESRKAYFAYSHMHLLDSDGRLRIGYLSKDWGFSSVGQLLPRLLAAHNRRRLQVHVFCLNADDGTPTRRVLEEEAEQWHHLHAASPLQVAEHINAAGINIVLDLGGHLSVTSQVALALQPAPLAVNYLSWLSTSGAPYIQSFLTDAVATPPEFMRWHSEALAYLPFSYQVNSNRYTHTTHYNPKARYTLLHPPHQPHGPPHPVDEDAIIFANFNQLFKVDPETAQAWARILHAVPNSVLAMLNFTGAPEGTRRLQHSLTPAVATVERGAGGGSRDAERVLFSPFCSSKKDFLVLAGGADIFLDNIFYNAGTTGSDVLFTGLPVLTLPSQRTLGRMGASLALMGLGYSALVARTSEEYIDLAVRLARNRRRLARVKAAVLRRVRRASLFDADAWVEAYEVLLFTLWDGSLSGRVNTGGGRPTEGQRQFVIARPV